MPRNGDTVVLDCPSVGDVIRLLQTVPEDSPFRLQTMPGRLVAEEIYVEFSLGAVWLAASPN